MANVMRWRSGDTKPVTTPAIASATVIEIGDLLYQDLASGAVNPFSSNGSTIDNVTDRFLGVAMQASRSGDTDPIRAATAGRFEFILGAASTGYSIELGELLGPSGSSGAWLDQTVDRVSAEASAIGRCAKRHLVGEANILVEITSAIMAGGETGTEFPSSSSGAS